MTPKLVIFDLDNTLINTRPAAKFGYKQAIYFLAKREGKYQDRDKLYNHWKRLVQTLHTDPDPLKRRFTYSLALLLEKHHLPEAHLTESVLVYEREMLAHLEPQPGAHELLRELKNRGILVAVATASEHSDATKKLKRTHLFPFIDNLVSATEIGRMKPNPLYYQLLKEQSKIKPASILVVGDDQTEDLDPARKLGMSTLLIPQKGGHLGVVLQSL
jgi:HAD superfamily hydrolase (TIGR01509 family)